MLGANPRWLVAVDSLWSLIALLGLELGQLSPNGGKFWTPTPNRNKTHRAKPTRKGAKTRNRGWPLGAAVSGRPLNALPGAVLILLVAAVSLGFWFIARAGCCFFHDAHYLIFLFFDPTYPYWGNFGPKRQTNQGRIPQQDETTATRPPIKNPTPNYTTTRITRPKRSPPRQANPERDETRPNIRPHRNEGYLTETKPPRQANPTPAPQRWVTRPKRGRRAKTPFLPFGPAGCGGFASPY